MPILLFLFLLLHLLIEHSKMKNAIKFFLPLFCFLTLSCNNAQKNNSTDKTPVNESGNVQRKIETRIFRNDTIAGSNLTGFGYDILVDGKLYIHQPHIPAVSGAGGFLTEEDARKTAEYASEKFRKTNTLPALSKPELDSLGIKY